MFVFHVCFCINLFSLLIIFVYKSNRAIVCQFVTRLNMWNCRLIFQRVGRAIFCNLMNPYNIVEVFLCKFHNILKIYSIKSLRHQRLYVTSVIEWLIKLLQKYYLYCPIQRKQIWQQTYEIKSHHIKKISILSITQLLTDFCLITIKRRRSS